MFLLVFMLHVFEEIITIEYWFNSIYCDTRERIPSYIIQQLEKSMTAGQFTIAVCVLFLAVSLFLIISVTTELYVFFGVPIYFLL